MDFSDFFEIAGDLEYLQKNQLRNLMWERDDPDYYNINALREILDYLERCMYETEIDVTDVMAFCKRMIEEMEA
tara:strand:+ start:670 stop:891 length:222 start_codon:yes stop_codon:yes gene_type:complete